MEIEAIKNVLAEWAGRKPLIKRVFVFGSRARGDHRPDSDLDIAVELDPNAFRGFDDSGGLATWMFESKGWEGELQALVPHTVQLEYSQGEETPTIALGLRRSSQLVYEKAPVGLHALVSTSILAASSPVAAQPTSTAVVPDATSQDSLTVWHQNIVSHYKQVVYLDLSGQPIAADAFLAVVARRETSLTMTVANPDVSAIMTLRLIPTPARQ